MSNTVDQTNETSPLQMSVGKTISDGVAAVGEGAGILNRYGPATVILAVFLLMFVAGAWIVRSDFRQSDLERTEAHERSMRYLADSHERSLKGVSESLLKVHADHREDAKEERAQVRANQDRLWVRFGEIRDGTLEQTKAVKELLEEFRKIANKMP